MMSRKILFSFLAALLLLSLLPMCGPRLIKLRPFMKECIRMETDQCDWGKMGSPLWVVQGDSVQIHSTIFNQAGAGFVDDLLIHVYDSTMVACLQLYDLIGTHWIRPLPESDDCEPSVPWRVPVPSQKEKTAIHARNQNYKRHIFYTLIDPYDKVDEKIESNNVARTPVNVLWKPELEITSQAKSSIRLVDSTYINVESPIIPIVFFGPQSAELTTDDERDKMLKEIGKRLHNNPQVSLVLKGYVDVKDEIGNSELALRRAESVREALEALCPHYKTDIRIGQGHDINEPFWRNREQPPERDLQEWQQENRRVEMEIKIDGASYFNGMELSALKKDDVEKLAKLLVQNQDIVLILEKPYLPEIPHERLNLLLWELQQGGALSVDSPVPWRIPPDRTAHIMPEKWAEIDTLLKKWQSEEFHVLKEIDGEKRQYLQWPDMSTLPRETVIKEDDPCRQDDDNYDLSKKVYIRTYACTTAAQPESLMVSGDPILFEPIRARYQFQIISQDDGKATFKILSSAGTRDL
ncbi:MAG: hypothetical protein JSV84_16530, partial [Gemmatimonadota bacterium]